MASFQRRIERRIARDNATGRLDAWGKRWVPFTPRELELRSLGLVHFRIMQKDRDARRKAARKAALEAAEKRAA